jgi:hypothetical protein
MYDASSKPDGVTLLLQHQPEGARQPGGTR